MVFGVKTAVIGCGVISDTYFENMIEKFSILDVVGCCDLNWNLAAGTAETYHIKAMTMEEILEDEEIEIVVNLTPPAAHYSIIKTLLNHGKHVYTEKVMSLNLKEARELVALADEKGLYLGAAPDTFLGAAAQTARFALDCGLIGEVSSCYAALNRDSNVMAERFPYTAKTGGGIGMDVAVYYVTELLSMLGPVKEVSGLARIVKPERHHYFTNGKDFGKTYTAESENLFAGTMEFESGVVGSLHFNSNSIQNEKPQVVLYGTQGILYLPDPNRFGGEVKVLLKGQTEPFVMPPLYAYGEDSRGIGVAEMAWSMREGRKNRANKEMACHVLEVLCKIVESGNLKKVCQLETTFLQMPPLPRGYLDKNYSKSDPEAGLALS